MARHTIIICALFVMVLAIYSPLFHADFTGYDDPTTIEFNPAFNPPSVQKLWPIWTAWGSRAPLGLYIPVTYSLWGSFASIAYNAKPDEADSYLNPWVFHAGNVLLHALTAVVVFSLLSRLLGASWPAFGGAIVFALHPVQVEAVAWASGTKDLLCGFLSVAAMLLYLEAAQAFSVKRIALQMAGTLIVLLAMLSKPTAIVTPLLAFVLDWAFLRRTYLQILADLWPWLLLMPACAAWAHAAQPATFVQVAPLWIRPILAADSVWFYIRKIIFPQHLATDYGRNPLTMMHSPMLTATAAAGVVTLVAWGWLARQRRDWLAAMALFVTGIAPVLGIVPFAFQQYSSVADHYLYLSMIGVALAVGLTLIRFANTLASIIYGIAMLCLIPLTLHQCFLWQHEIGLWQHCVSVNPDSLLARTNYGATLYRADRLTLAEQQFRAAERLDPNDLDAQDNLALILLATARPAEAAEHLHRELQLNAQLPLARQEPVEGVYLMLGQSLLASGDPTGAKAAFSSALRENPHSAQALAQLKIATTRAATSLPF